MFKARDFRRIARDKLRGNWGKALLVSLVAGLLMGSLGISISLPSNVLSILGNRVAINEIPDGFFSSDGIPDDFFSSEGIPDDFFSSGRLPGGYSSFGGYEYYFDDVFGAIEDVFSDPAFRTAFGLATGIIVFFGLLIGTPIALAMTFVSASTQLGHNLWYIDRIGGKRPEFVKLFQRFKYFFKAGGLILFMGLFVWLWSLLLVIPGIIASYRYWAAPWIMAEDPSVGIREAVRRSKEMMRGKKWRLFCLELSFIGWGLLNLLTLGIGSLWLTPYMTAAFAAFYYDATGRQIPVGDVAEAPIAPAPAATPVIAAPAEPVEGPAAEPVAEPFAEPVAEPDPYAQEGDSDNGVQ